MKKRGVLIAIAVLLCFLSAVSRLEQGRTGEGRQQLEDALRRTAVSCYASEGFYPPNVKYMVQHYGLQYDEDAYRVHYEIFASNLMPEITVVERQP
ncbi:MAG: hypothetical protein IKT52_06145 [Oscillospiraceae bacterium]|nr:hypothetical protein [Oscillospiraceae bacterium]